MITKRKMKRGADHPDNAKGLAHKFVTLTRGQYSKVDADHFDVANQFKWYALWTPGTKSYYAVRNIRCDDGTQGKQRVHQFIGELIGLDLSDGRTVDHRNRDTLDNTRDNLRSATKSEQNLNQRKPSHNTSGIIGVVWHKRDQKWQASAMTGGKSKFLGLFDDRISATWVREAYVKEHHGEFAKLNNPPERRGTPR